jgi:hypothetical protein
MFEPPISSDILVKLVPIQHVKIIIPLNTIQQHLPEMFFQLEVGEMEIDEMLARIKVQYFALQNGLSLKKSN